MLTAPAVGVGPLRWRRPLRHDLRRLDPHLHADALGPRSRPRRTLPLEFVVKKQTKDTATLYGLGDRGSLEVGLRADINVIDFENLRLGSPWMAHDLPVGRPPPAAGRRRLRLHHRGRRGHPGPRQDTGARPGRLVRGARCSTVTRAAPAPSRGARLLAELAPQVGLAHLSRRGAGEVVDDAQLLGPLLPTEARCLEMGPRARGGQARGPGVDPHEGATCSPRRGSGAATTATSITPGMRNSSSSTSRALMFSPPRMMMSFLRSTMVM